MTSKGTENRIFVSQVPASATNEDLVAHFSQFGSTSDVYLPLLFGTNQPKGIAYVSFDSAESKELALQSDHLILDQEVLVQVCIPKGGLPKGGSGKGALPVQTNDGDRVFITQIAQDATQEDVQAYFAEFGDWTDFYMPRGKFSAGHKGICFITYNDPDSVTQVLQTQPHHINGQQVVVDIATPRDVKGVGKGAGMVATPAASAQLVMPRAVAAVVRPPSAWPAVAVQQRVSQQPAGAILPGRLFLTKVSPTITQDDLTTYFEQFGTVNDAYIPSGGKAIAFVGFDDPSIASAVAEMVQHEVKAGCLVNADPAIDRATPGKGHGKQRFQPY